MAAPMIRPWYDPHFDPGTPAIVSFWAAFVGERQRMLGPLMEARLKQMDTTDISREINELNKQIGAMMKARADRVTKHETSFGNLMRNIVSGEAQVRSAEVRAQGIVAAERIEAGVKMEELDADDRADLRALGDLSDESEQLLENMRKNLVSYDSDAQRQFEMKRVYREIVAQEGLERGSTKDDLVKYKMGLHAHAAASENEAAGSTATWWGDQNFDGKRPTVWWEGKVGPSSAEAQAERRARVMAPGAGGASSILDDLLRPVGGGAVQVGGGPPGAAAGPGGAFAPAGAGQGAWAGGAGTAQPGAATGGQPGGALTGQNLLGTMHREYRGLIEPDLASIDAEVARLQADRARLMAQRDAMRGQEGGLFAGFGFNYLLESPFQVPARSQAGKWGRIQARIDALNAADPTVRKHAMGAIETTMQRPGMRGARAMEAANELLVSEFRTAPPGMPAADPQGVPRPGLYLDQAGAEDAGEGVFSWAFDELVATRDMIANPDTAEEGLQRLMALSKQAGALLQLDPTLYAEHQDFFETVSAAVAEATHGLGGAPRLIVDEEGTYLYGQNADGSVYYTQDFNEQGQPLQGARWTKAEGAGLDAIVYGTEKVQGIGPHPAQAGPQAARARTAQYLHTASRVANEDAKNDRLFAEVASGAITDAQGLGGGQTIRRYEQIGAATHALPYELTGSYGDVLTYVVRARTDAGEGTALHREMQALESRGRELGQIERERIPREERDDFRSRMEEADDARWNEAQQVQAAEGVTAAGYRADEAAAHATARVHLIDSELAAKQAERAQAELIKNRAAFLRESEAEAARRGMSLNDYITRDPLASTKMDQLRAAQSEVEALQQKAEHYENMARGASIGGAEPRVRAGLAESRQRQAEVAGPSESIGVPADQRKARRQALQQELLRLSKVGADAQTELDRIASQLNDPATGQADRIALMANQQAIMEAHQSLAGQFADIEKQITMLMDPATPTVDEWTPPEIAPIEAPAPAPAPEPTPKKKATTPMERAAEPAETPAPSTTAEIPVAWETDRDLWAKAQTMTPAERADLAARLKDQAAKKREEMPDSRNAVLWEHRAEALLALDR